MYPVLFHIPYFNLPIQSYGVMMVIGFLVSIELAKYLAKRANLNPELFVNAGLLALVTGVAGARISHVLENFAQYTDPHRTAWANFSDAINIHAGGLTYYGGFLLAFPSLVFYAIKKKIPVRIGMDIIAPCLMVGLGFGRIGCFLNGCCYGGVCDVPWAVHFPYGSLAYEEEFDQAKVSPPPQLLAQTRSGFPRLITPDEISAGALVDRDEFGQRIPVDPQAKVLAAAQSSQAVHPAELYSTITAFLIAGITVCYFTLPHAAGTGFALMLMLEGLTRYILELLRVEPAVIGRFSLSMVLGIALAVLGVILWIAFRYFARRDNHPTGVATSVAM